LLRSGANRWVSMSSKTPGQRHFLIDIPGVENPLIYLHTAEVSGSIPLAPTKKHLVDGGFCASGEDLREGKERAQDAHRTRLFVCS